MMLFEDILSDMGCEVVGQASDFNEAIEKANSLSFDLAILDVSLMGKQTFPIADTILRRGIPFVFASGYGPATIPPDLQVVPILQKPFERVDLEGALRAAMSE
jgi:CheY-like chemotaxis protein